MRTTGLRLVFLVTLVMILTSAMTTASTGSEYPCLNVTTNGIENTGSMELAEVHYRDTSGQALGVFVSGDYAYVADGLSGLAVIDISDPTNPGTPVYIETTSEARGVYVSGDYAYVADEFSGLEVIDISDPTNPGTPVYEDTSGYAEGVFVSGDYAYLAVGGSGLAVINITDPTNPGTPVYEDTSGSAEDVYVSGDYAYVADHTSGLAVIDISDPTNPGTPVYEDTTGYANGVFVSGDYAYVADSDSGLAVIDISNPTNPGTPVYEDTAHAMGVFVSGDYAYIADNVGLAVINITDPTNPGTPVYEDTSGSARGVYVSGDYAYVADWYSGLAVIVISEIQPSVRYWLTFDQWFLVIMLIGVVSGLGYRRRRKRRVPPIVPPPRIVETTRGCEMVGGKFEYKAKIVNGTDSVINNVTVIILAYPKDCMEIEGEHTRTISRIEPGGFRSPQFVFVPTKDCVEGQILANVSYIDHANRTQSINVEPYTIRSVCDLLQTHEATIEEFEMLLHDMSANSEKRIVDVKPEVVYSVATSHLPERNFYVIDSLSDTSDNSFRGIIRALAKGKYTGKNVAVRLIITGEIGGRKSEILVEALGDDASMLPTIIRELIDGIDDRLSKDSERS